jgi:hypothetical protein
MILMPKRMKILEKEIKPVGLNTMILTIAP